MDSNPLLDAERRTLLAEIASLEEQIASFSDDKQRPPAPPAKRPRPAEDSELDEGIEKTIRALLAGNDSALLAAHPPKPKNYQESEQTSIDLERAYELVQANASFTGLVLSEAESRLITVDNNHQLRQHTLVGTLPSPMVPLGFRVQLTVQEPRLVGELDPSAIDPGREYEVVGTEAVVWGGGGELQRAVNELQLARRPNPPALFARLREYSLLASQRAELFSSLRESLGEVVVDAPATGGARSAEEDGSVETTTSLGFSNPSRSLSLRLSYSLEPSPLGSLAPVFSLTPILSSSLRAAIPEASLSVLEEIPRRFERMLAEGFEVGKVVELLVKGVLMQ
ncbi:hypothetical protein BCR35DRAFT_45705 [Leucosporidium creatinivorum]|uniref:Uncharacterized protein n=1 Tax=Leucosporidium creatinivorum TaxID=106004 RepID=A0A1Y2FU67_9BASI|nr:hypothetical protein BCR35DRAFT_45705 [Leucosporidium creatinivorum]